MQFLGDAGGIYSSLFLLGAALNFIFTGKDRALQLLADHFFVNMYDLEEGNACNWIRGYISGIDIISTRDKIIFGTFIQYLPTRVMYCCRKSPRQERLKRLIERTDAQLERTLDIRTLLRL